MRLEWNVVEIAFAYFLWKLKHVMKRCLWSAFTHDLTEVTRPTANLRYQHEKVCTIVKILCLVHTLTLWHCCNKLFYLQSQTFHSYLQKKLFFYLYSYHTYCFSLKTWYRQFLFACHKSGGWLRKSICYLKCIKKMSKCEKNCVEQLRAIRDIHIRYFPEFCLPEKVFSKICEPKIGFLRGTKQSLKLPLHKFLKCKFVLGE